MAGERLIRGTSGEDVRVAAADVGGLSRALDGELIEPGAPSYETARRVWNGLIDKRPGLVVRCASERDVATGVLFARDRGLELAVRGGGHNVGGRAISDGGVVLDLGRMRDVSVDAGRRVATVAGGATLGDLNDATLPSGLAAPTGVVSDTGVGGLTLHGGYGWLSRHHGLAVDNLVAARVVTADGRVLRASADEHPDLHWALRGGGGNFGVVTSFDFRLHALPPRVWFALVLYPIERAAEVVRAFSDFMPGAPDELMAIALYWSAPPIPAVPAQLHGAPVLIVAGVWSGEPERAPSALEPLRTAARPIADLTAPMPFAQVERFFDEDYPNGRFYYWKSMYLSAIDERLSRLVTREAARRPSALSGVEYWALGGAIARVGVAETAFAHREAQYLLGIEANWTDPAATRENLAWARGLHREAEPYSRGAAYLNFAGFGEEGERLVRAAYGPNYERLRRVKALYDPDNVFRGNFNVTPAGAQTHAPGP